ncbi:MAG: hypothetical protein ABSG65_16500 [Bryobacteraceae bacterium]|jgi:hypothetical protein
MRWLGFLLAALPLVAGAEDARLTELRERLVPLRKTPAAHLQVRGATPELAVVNHQLKVWVESRL